VLYYQRGAEGDNVPETIIGRGPTTEPLVVEVTSTGVFVCSIPLLKADSKDHIYMTCDSPQLY